MLFLVEYTWRAIPDDDSEPFRQHRQSLVAAKESGILRALWHKASGQGDVLVIDVADHAALRAFLRELPMSSKFERITATPLIADADVADRS